MLYQKILQLFYPSYCVSCQQLVVPETIFCASCVSLLKPVVSVFLPLTQKHSLKVLAAGAYLEPLKPLVLRKFNQDVKASKQLAQLILQTVPHQELEADYIIPIPLHWTRYAWRGYNQAYVMATALSATLNVPVLSILQRKRRTQFQSRLNEQQREENVYGVFDIKKWHDSAVLKNKKILLVDDLCTTGVTLQSAAKVLLKAKPEIIKAVVACRGIWNYLPGLKNSVVTPSSSCNDFSL